MELHDKIWWTRKSRIQTEKRLLSNDLHAQIILIWYSFFSVSISIYYLITKSNSAISPGVWVILSVFSLTASGFITGLNYRTRASLIKDCYEKLDSLYSEAQRKHQEKDTIVDTCETYKNILNLCENHLEIDYRAARCKMYLSGDKQFNPKINIFDFAYWLIYLAKRWLFIASINIAPALIFYKLEF